ncbi:LURP-one-related/scramblase family protein [Streptomonospora wellingtoniae]|uniref:LURP-one-related family protein n=1 Tax=Streptomonospora wellingtoniae TaxID=3075544 RepID=A0ABU2KNU5_9ACTN|nr:LURP-one-related family protein [Streptomonospora sp. DSM 45055]MDT0300935.1 LURP-one-related family protein [Streptomonospora sp. DSM 45055]
MKFTVRDRVFDIGDDYWVEDEDGERAFLVDGKALRLRETFELKDPDGNELAVIRKKLFSIRDTMRVERGGETVATVRKRMFNPIKDKLVVELADGPEWEITGDFLDKEYAISDDSGPIAHISRKWFRIRDAYAVDVNTYRDDPGGDPALVISVAVCVDALTDESEESEEE